MEFTPNLLLEFMKSKLSFLSLFFEGVIPVVVSVFAWPSIIGMILHADWITSAWGIILLLLIMGDILFVLSIYPLAVFVKCLVYDYHTFLEFDLSQQVVTYERKGLSVRFSLSEVKSFNRIHPFLRSALGTIYEIELNSGHIITVTDLLAVSRQIEKNFTVTNDYYESVLFRKFYNHQPKQQ